MGSFLEYLYNGEYFPKRIGDARDGPLESDPTVPVPDNDGAQLLKHARVYTLADKFFMPVSIPLVMWQEDTNQNTGPQISCPLQDPPHHQHSPR